MWNCVQCGASDESNIPPALCAKCGGVETYGHTEAPARAIVGTELLGRKYERLSTGDRDFDALLLGGFAVGTTAVIWGRAGCGKSRSALRWASRLGPALVLSLEMADYLTAESAESAGANVSRLFITDSAQGYESEARKHGARVVLLDSVSHVERHEARPLLKSLETWARENQGVALVICHENKRGGYAGPSWIGHWPDYLLRMSPRGKGRAHVRVRKSRYCPIGFCTVPII